MADTGDDVAVSRAVARLIFADYELPDPDAEGCLLVRAARRDPALRRRHGLSGGDRPGDHQPRDRAVQSGARDFARLDLPRVLLGIPGNHDWYDGLDGFARMFRRNPDDEEGVPGRAWSASRSA